MIDYHVHTPLCNHASGSMEQYIRRAIAIGLEEICFLDHLTLHEGGRYLSMGPGDVPFYFHAARRLAEKHKDQIRVKVGLEVDFDKKNAGSIKGIIKPYSFDVIGGSVHFIEGINIVSTRETETRDKAGMEDICRQYLDNIDAMLDYNIADIICHLDVVKKFGRRIPAVFEKKFDEILSKISYKNLTVELNTSGYDHPANEPYPGALLLEKCHEKKIHITIGSDAHLPEDLGRHYATALEMLRTTGYRHVSAFTRQKRYEIPLPPTIKPGPEVPIED